MKKNNIILPRYSVLMSVYSGENPDFFRASVESILDQTYPPDDFVLVCDGTLTHELENAVRFYEENYECFRPVRLANKVGTGECGNIGIEHCKNEYIVKMDSDDIALPNRCEISMYVLAKHPEIDILGAFIDEFDSDTGVFISTKKTPVSHKEIVKYARRRNPFNNQTLVFKKTFAKKIGGYSNIKRCEDYEFVVKMLASGARGRNIGRTLVKYRTSPENFVRRKNWRNTKSFIQVRWRIYKMGFSHFMDFIVPCAAQLVMFALPSAFTRKIYKKILRK